MRTSPTCSSLPASARISLLGAEPLPVERERAGIAVRQRMLDAVRVGSRCGSARSEEEADAVEEDGEVVAHPATLNVRRVQPASKGRTAYPAGQSDLVFEEQRGHRNALLAVARAGRCAARPRRPRPGRRCASSSTAPSRSQASPARRPARSRSTSGRAGSSTACTATARSAPRPTRSWASRSPRSTRLGPSLPDPHAGARRRAPRSARPGGAGSCSGASATRRSTPADLRTLASKLRAAGIRRVTGRIVGDETYFDTRRTAAGLARRPTTRSSRRRSRRSSSTAPA